MKKLHLNEAVPAMPDHFAKRMTDTLGGLEDMKRTHKLTVGVAIALAAMLTLAGAACAAQTGILDFIFRGTEPGADSAKAVRQVNASAQGEYMDFTVHDYVFDGTDLYANWTLQMKTDEPLVLISTGMRADFEEGVFGEGHIPDSLAANNPMTDCFEGGVWSGMNVGHFYDYTPDAPFEVTMKLALVRPDENAVMLKSGELGEYPGQPVWWNVDDSTSWSWGLYATEHEVGSDDYEHWEQIDARAAQVGYFDAWLEYFEEYGFGEPVERLEVKFTVVPEGFKGKRLERSETFRLKDFDLTVERAEFTGFGAEIELRLEFARPVSILEDAMPVFTAYADGQALEFAQQTEGFGGENAQFVCELWSQNGCALLPDVIALETDSGERVEVNLR